MKNTFGVLCTWILLISVLRLAYSSTYSDPGALVSTVALCGLLFISNYLSRTFIVISGRPPTVVFKLFYTGSNLHCLSFTIISGKHRRWTYVVQLPTATDYVLMLGSAYLCYSVCQSRRST